jgi:hypothetical protein
MPDLQALLEDYLAGLADSDWDALTARVRPPTEPTQPAVHAALITGTRAPQPQTAATERT